MPGLEVNENLTSIHTKPAGKLSTKFTNNLFHGHSISLEPHSIIRDNSLHLLPENPPKQCVENPQRPSFENPGEMAGSVIDLYQEDGDQKEGRTNITQFFYCLFSYLYF